MHSLLMPSVLLADTMILAMGWGSVIVGMCVGALLIAFPSKRKSPTANDQ